MTSLDDIRVKLGARAYNALCQNGFATAEEVAATSDDELIKLWFVGEGSIKHIRKVLTEVLNLPPTYEELQLAYERVIVDLTRSGDHELAYAASTRAKELREAHNE